MTIEELKNSIEKNNLGNSLVIFKCSGNSEFIVRQYINEYKNKNDIEVNYIDNVDLLPKKTFITSSIKGVFICNIDSLTAMGDNVDYDNNIIWIVTKKIGKKITNTYADYILELPKIEDWHIKDYIKTQCKGLSSKYCEYLFNTYKDNLFRLEIEISKLNLFNDKQEIYNIIHAQLYTDISDYGIFDLVNAIVRKDTSEIGKIYKQINNIDIEPFGLLKLLIDNFTKISSIQLTKNPNAEKLGISSKQFWFLQKNLCHKYTNAQLVYILEFLYSIDYKIKSGQLNISILNDYLITRIINL